MDSDDEGTDWTLIARHCVGESSADDDRRVTIWLLGAVHRRAVLAQLKCWSAEAAALPSRARIDALWKQLARLLGTAVS